MDITSNGGSDFRQLAGEFRKAGKDGAAVRKALTKVIQAELKTIVAEQKRNFLAVESRGVSGRGTARREAFFMAHHKRNRGTHGLRAASARSIKSKVNYTGRRIGARISIDASMLPRSQRKMPAHINRGRVRHPVWGHRDRWVQQTFTPPGAFDKPIIRHRQAVRRKVEAAVTEVLRTLK